MVSTSSSFAFLLLLVVLTSNVDGALFVINGTLNCPLEFFRYHMVILEHDFLFHSTISRQGIKFSSRPHFYEISAAEYGDGITSWYEIGMELDHTCNDNNVRRKLKLPVGDFPVGNKYEAFKTFYKTMDIDVYNKGDLVADPRHRFMSDDHE